MNYEMWQQSGETVRIGGLDVFRIRAGEGGVPVLCLHGFPTSSFDYHKVWAALAGQFPLVAFDMIGYGFSSKPIDFNYTTFRQADILENALAESGITRVHILAHDYGNTITQEFLARRDESRLGFAIESICFMNGALFPETHRPILAQKLLISPVGRLFAKFLTDGRFKASLASVFGRSTQPSDQELDEILAIFKHNDGKRVAHLLIRYMTERATNRDRWVGALQKIGVPFRFINGLDDPVSGGHLVARFREVVPHETDIVEMEKIGHFPHLEAPGKVIETYLAFRRRAKA
ncbi:MAG TPA: alpha/beta hydrolase [Pyrinomonadaceae bacterium]|nr:alpha/beta hydrolase [Pyrinomonadaceae bacterium]HNU06713.1 alpha/beta hydrolase [Pyrinomonadaceae bacterium]